MIKEDKCVSLDNNIITLYFMNFKMKLKSIPFFQIIEDGQACRDGFALQISLC